MADIMTMAVIHCLVGFEVFTFGFQSTHTNDEPVEGLLIIAFLLYIVAAVLTVLMKAGPLDGNKIVQIVTAILLLVAGLFIIAGAGKWYDDTKEISRDSYTMTHDMAGAFLAIIAGVLMIVCAAGKGGSTSPA